MLFWEYFEHKNTQISEKNEFFLRKNAFFLIFCLQFLKIAVILQSKNKPFFSNQIFTVLSL